MDLSWLSDFEELAESGNFSRAAASRHVTQPAFSRRIRALEHWAGASLFERGSQPVSLTEAGIRLRPLFRDVTRRLDQARAEADAAASESLRFAATHALSFSFFPAWLSRLPPLPAALPIHLISGGLDACERMMRSGSAEFLLCHSHPAVPARLPASEFKMHRLGRDRLLPVSAPGPDSAPLFRTADPRALQLGYGAGSGLGRILQATMTVRESAPVFTSHLAATLRTMARDGRGLAWLPESLIALDLADGSIVDAGGPEEAISVEICLFRSSSGLSRAGRAFWSQLPEELQ